MKFHRQQPTLSDASALSSLNDGGVLRSCSGQSTNNEEAEVVSKDSSSLALSTLATGRVSVVGDVKRTLGTAPREPMP